MTLVAVALLAAAGIGLLRGGSLTAVAAVRFERIWLVAVGVGAQVAAAAGPAGTRLLLLVATHAAIGAFLWSNRRLPGAILVAAGWGLNVAVILANGGMPVSAQALAAAGGSGALRGGVHVPLVAGMRLEALADVIAIPALGVVVSVGDLVLSAGAGVMIVRLMGQPHPGARGAGNDEPT